MLTGGFGTKFAAVTLLNKMHLWLARGSDVGKAFTVFSHNCLFCWLYYITDGAHQYRGQCAGQI